MRSCIALRLASLALATFFAASAVAAPTLTVTAGAVYNANSAQATVTATVPTLIAPPTAASTYTTAFNNWNASGGGQGWTLAFGASLGADTKFNITTYRAFVTGATGGVEILMTYTQGADAPNPATQANVGDPETAFWSQSIVTNDPLNGNTSPYLDISEGTNNGGSTFDAPLYPFQYADTAFYDAPRRTVVPPNGPSKSWTGSNYLVKRNLTTKTLTVYDGITYGFTVAPVPEPATLVTLGVGALVLLRRKRGARV